MTAPILPDDGKSKGRWHADHHHHGPSDVRPLTPAEDDTGSRLAIYAADNRGSPRAAYVGPAPRRSRFRRFLDRLARRSG